MSICKDIQKLHPKKQAFLKHFSNLGVVGKAALATPVHRQTVYDWLEKDPVFKVAFDQTRQDFVEKLETEAVRRAYEGWDEPVFYKGMEQGMVRKYSDTLLIFLLKGNAPEKYRDNQHVELTGENGKALKIIVKWDGNKDSAGSTSP